MARAWDNGLHEPEGGYAPVARIGLGSDRLQSFRAHQETVHSGGTESQAPTAAVSAVEESELESHVICDMLELESIGAGVSWPKGLDARIARSILNQREARALAAAQAAEVTTATAGGSTSSNSSSSSSSSSSSCSSRSCEPQPKRQRTAECEGAQESLDQMLGQPGSTTG